MAGLNDRNFKGPGLRVWLCAGAALLLVVACERPTAVAARGEAPASEARGDRTFGNPETTQEREAGPVRQIAGKPLWSSSKKGSAEENAQRSFERNGEAFGADNLDDFVRKAHAFVDDPPAGTQRLKRSNGDTLFYDPKANVFAVANKQGVPRTLFKPDQGSAYWQEQKDREAKRQTAASDSKGSRQDNG